MKKRIARKPIIIAVAGLLAAALLVGAWAFYTSTGILDNQMKTKKYGDTLLEKFTPSEDWQPGEEITKEVGVKNTGDYDLVVRVKLNEQWSRGGSAFKEIASTGGTPAGVDQTKINYTSTAVQPSHDGGTTPGPVDGVTTNDETVVKKIMNNTGTGTGKWTLYTDGYWYYNDVLTAGGETSKLMEKIMLATDADMGKYDVVKYWTENATVAATEPVTGTNVGSSSTTQWVVYTGEVPSPTVATNDVYTRSVSQLSSDAGYAGAIYDLFITSETCQATSDAVAATWSGAPAALAGTGGSWGF